ncbi:DUF3872 domain-containing protein [Chishuiella sp.]|uniref:DUF3872 domain-containing protein n=1 Tax=Chishuiella sp. TaxID=1969467 RepID=UPI0028AF0AAC|nr:DUF3872 domain-containing protein [Chishuiella sp.]
MKLLYKNTKRIIRFLIIIILSFLNSCQSDNELDIQTNFPFEVVVMPVPKEITNGQTVEIRLSIEPTGHYKETEYKLRYFQFDGEGILQYNQEDPYIPNDLYDLPTKQFRLYYTSNSSVSQSFDVWISDQFGNEKQISFQFNHRDNHNNSNR